MTRVRVKICGLTRAQDVAAAVAGGADALGFNCYDRSPRFVDSEQLELLARAVPPFVTSTLLFVNAPASDVRRALERVPQALLQFHGDEDERYCASFGRPYIRAVSMGEGVDLLDCERRFASSSALLVDTPTAGYGGSGEAFDWRRLPGAAERRKPLVLAGGLTEQNVAAAIAAVQPYAVDVSSGVESNVKGIKDPARIERFIAAVAAAQRAFP